MAHYPGTSQGRNASESGRFGCTLVEVDDAGAFALHRVACDGPRYATVQLRVEEHTSRGQFEQTLDEHIKELQTTHAGHPLLVTWRIAGHGRLWRSLNDGPLAAELVDHLRREALAASASDGEPGIDRLVWTIGLSTKAADVPQDPAADTETLLDDFLRLVRQWEADDEQPLKLDRYLDCPAEEVPAAIWHLKDPAARKQVLREAAIHGVQLLQGGR